MKKNEIRLTIGDIGFSICFEDSKVTDWPHKFYTNFLDCKKVDVKLIVKCGRLPDYKERELLFDAGYSWKLFRDDNRYIFVEYDVGTKKKDRVIFMNLDLTEGEVYMIPDRKNILSKIFSPKSLYWSIHRLMDPFFKVLLANKIIKKDGLMVHGFSVHDNNKGVIFIGRSGTGKSTLANMYKDFKGATIINDEKTILLKEGNDYYIRSTPWPGDALTVNRVEVLLNKIYFIKHNKINEVNSLSAMDAFNIFFPQIFLPFWDKELIGRAMEFSNDLISEFKPEEFGFIKDKKAVEFIRRVYGH